MSFKLLHWTLTVLLFLSLGLAFEQPAHAYTDPGSTLLLFQSLGAAASGALFYFRRQLRRLFSRNGVKKPAAASAVMTRSDS